MRGALLVLTCLVTGSHSARAVGGDPVITLQGVLQVGRFFGPPNYGEDPQSDLLESSFYLQLPATPETQVPEFQVPEDAEGIEWSYFVQLVVDDSVRERARALVGRRVAVSGTAFGAVTGHHRTPILLTVHAVRSVERFQW